MLPVSFGLIAAAALFGSVLALLHLRPAGQAFGQSVGQGPPWPFGALHGVIGASGLAALLVTLQGPPRGVAYGVGSFGVFAAVLLGLAFLAGLFLLGVLRLGRRANFLIAVHAGLAVAGFAILSAYTLLG
ncbi:MAG TPA: hypothetical protein VMA37_17675 [Acetobacteraceae bacterium]|nr:hypothetical protein [Acetobacteraceae bacterium]